MSGLPYLLASFSQYLRFYRDYFSAKWEYMTPMEYGILLISIGVFGFALMKNASKR
ncbi:MAG: hypothetical protein KDA75_19755 [Planctomycetaceae bacterium]|nr:hypothetical protein [Planctomycetaceae bacterium]